MTKKTDDKNAKDDDKDLDNEEADNESEEEEDEEDEESDEEEDEEDEEDEESDEEEDEEDEEEEEAAPAKASSDKPADRRRPRHEEYLEGDGGGHRAPAEDPTWWAPHAVLGLLVMLGVLGFLGVFNKALGFLAPKQDSSESSTATHTTTTPSGAARPPVTMQPQQAQPPREMFGAKHLLVMYKGSRRAPPTIERSKDDAKARATEAMKKAKADPSKFGDLVKEYTDEPGAEQRGGDLGKFPKGAMVPEFQTGLEKIKVGEISDVVETPFGFHVILRTQ